MSRKKTMTEIENEKTSEHCMDEYDLFDELQIRKMVK
jgi:hypothetical protein